MTRWMPRIPVLVALGTLVLSAGGLAQSGRPRDAIVILSGLQATLPIPTLMEGPASSQANVELADQLFLRLAELGPKLRTAGDEGFTPALAKSWRRRDSVTLAFDLDPRARWQDGRSVTARDVVFTFERARDPAISPKLATLLRDIVAVTAEGERRVVFRFTHPYSEQVYDATYHVAPLPAHLLERIPPAELARSTYVTHPIGSGPYRWVRSVPGEFTELAAFDGFLLGRPEIRRVIVRAASDPDARINLVLSGEADAIDNISPPLSNLRRVGKDPELLLVPMASPSIGYLLFNARDPRDSTRPHPILSDARVRHAIGLALDRRLMVRAVLGDYGEVPFGPAASLLWIGRGTPRPAGRDLAQARRLLAVSGWRDSDGDGTLDRDGRSLALSLNLPNTSTVRGQMALLIQQQLRAAGVRLDLRRLEGPVWLERRSAGDFDIDFSSASQDPSPSGLMQSWSCHGGLNVAHYCGTGVDSLLERARLGEGDTRRLWHDVLRQIEADAPAVFLYTPIYVYAVHRRFTHVRLRAESSWLLLREWTLRDNRDGA